MEPPFHCRHCGQPIMWSLDFRRWVHEHPKVVHCTALFDAINNPTTPGAEPDAE